MALFTVLLAYQVYTYTSKHASALVSPLSYFPARSNVHHQLFLADTTDTSSAAAAAAPILVTDNAPSWESLRQQVLATPTGIRLQQEADDREKGLGPPHTDALLRLFDANDDSDIRVTFYRDRAAWCPYCQKVWLLLEEKRIPYRVKKVPMNAYGEKPDWYSRMVDGGKLPAVELDGKLQGESLEIMELLDGTFSNHGPRMIPPECKEQIDALLHLEKELQRDWFSLVFYPVEGDALTKTRKNLFDTLQKVDHALGSTPGPWFLGGDAPSMVDLQYISHMERLLASVLYWKGLVIRGRFEKVDQWLAAFDERPSYLATKSDSYTLCMAIPSQNGPGYFVREAKDIAANISGLDGAWELPLDKEDYSEPLATLQFTSKEAACQAAYSVIENHGNVVQFASRGAGEPGRPSFRAELADPFAEPNEDYMVSVDVCLRHVTHALIKGIDCTHQATQLDLQGRGGNDELRENWEPYEDDNGRSYYWNYETGDSTWTPPTRQLDTCLAYLRDRIGVPRDMGPAAAMQLRAHLNWAITSMK
jgi:glutathione S-transferase